MRLTLISLLALATACGSSDLAGQLHPSGSSSIAADHEHDRLFAVNVHEGSVSLIDPDRNDTTTIDVGEEPTRIARVGDRMVVTLRGERALAELDATTGELLRTLPTGPEPFGVVASEDGSRVYVSIAMGGIVEERDGSTLEVLRTFEVGSEPRWLALHPEGDSLVVAFATGERLTAIDLDDGTLSDLWLPEHRTDVFVDGANQSVRLAGRVTGDPTFATDGRTLVIPGLYVDNTSGEQGTGGVPSFPYYKAAQTTTLGRFNATLVLYQVRGGIPEPQAETTQLVADFADPDVGGVVLRSYLSSVTPSPDGLAWLATMEASDSVMLVDATSGGTRALDGSGLAFPNVAVGLTDRGPRGLAIRADGSVQVHSFLDRTIADIRYTSMREAARDEIVNRGFPVARPTPAAPSLVLTESALTPEQHEGAELFFSAADASMGAAGVSCSTCHFDGRTDGLTWNLMNGERQTPSLAGLVSETAPVTWTNDVPSVAEEAQFTAQFRMGTALDGGPAGHIEQFVDFVRLPDLPEPDDADAVARGQALFERADVGCAQCHSGPALTDNQHHDLYGLIQVNTPTLRGIAASAPYLHDGTALTLRDVLIRSRDGSMGDTSSLSDAELDDLETYLRAL